MPTPPILAARPNVVRVRTACEADRPGIRELFRASFGVDRGDDAWAWKYDRGPAGPGAASVALDGDGRIVAHYAGFPVRFRSGEGATVTAFHVGDISSARDVRHLGRGATSVFGRVNRHFHDVHCRDRVAFNYGFNTGTSRAFAYRFAGAVEVEPVPYRRRDATPPPGSGRYRVSAILRAGAELDSFFDRVASAYGTLVVRDARYLGWRYFARPDAEYLVLAARRWGRLRGWAVFRRHEDRLLWGDALVDPAHPGAAAALLAAALALPAQRGVEAVEAWFPSRPTFWGAVLDGLGFETAPEPRDLSLVCVPHRMADAAAFLRRAYVTMGDGDLF